MDGSDQSDRCRIVGGLTSGLQDAAHETVMAGYRALRDDAIVDAESAVAQGKGPMRQPVVAARRSR